QSDSSHSYASLSLVLAAGLWAHPGKNSYGLRHGVPRMARGATRNNGRGGDQLRRTAMLEGEIWTPGAARRGLPGRLGGSGAQAERRPGLLRLLLVGLAGDIDLLFRSLLRRGLLRLRGPRLGREDLATGRAQVRALALEAGDDLRNVGHIVVAQPHHVRRAGL